MMLVFVLGNGLKVCFNIMKKLILLLLFIPLFFSCNKEGGNDPFTYSIEGKWLWSPTLNSSDSNTMYLFEDGTRYTYYCTSEISNDCQSLYESFQANDGNHLPATNPYTFENGVLKIDLHHGNELVAPITFDCDGGKIYVESQNPHYLYRLNSNCQ